MPENRRSGTLSLQIDGVTYDLAGHFTYNLGVEKRETKVGPNGVQGYSGMPQAPFIEGEITDASDLDVKALLALENATLQLDLANGKRVVQRNSWCVSEGTIGTEQANIQVRFEGRESEEI